MISSYSENDFATFYIDSGVLYFIYKPIELVSLSMAKSMTRSRLEFQKGKPFPVFCDTRSLQNVDKAAREYFANEGMFLAKAVGLLVSHQATEALVDFFVRINKPVVPTKICKSETEALAFLRPYAL